MNPGVVERLVPGKTAGQGGCPYQKGNKKESPSECFMHEQKNMWGFPTNASKITASLHCCADHSAMLETRIGKLNGNRGKGRWGQPAPEKYVEWR